MATKLTLKNTQQLTLTPLIQTFISFLPLNRIEFINRIHTEVDSNPMLEIVSPPEGGQAKENPPTEIEKKLEQADSSFLNTYEEQGFFKRDENYIDKNRAIELFTAFEETLCDYLVKQALAQFNEKELPIAEQIIYNLDPDGYLSIEIESIASLLNTTPEEIDRIRKIITSFDPPGIAAKTLSECLLAQIKETESEKLKILITDHLENLSKYNYKGITHSMNISLEELSELITQLKHLNPKPASLFEKEFIDYAEVDLMLIKENEEYTVKFIDEGIPRLQLSSYYEQMLNKSIDKKTSSFLKQKHKDAQLFIEGVGLRKNIIVRIVEYLIKKQKDYLDFGEKWKKPLTMKEVAQKLNYNESTISRAVNNKFITTPQGIISVKSFFSHGIKGDFGFMHSVQLIKDKIKKIIDEEANTGPLSDQEIEKKLANLGIKISRRTIRNYRKELNIPNSSQRKKRLD